jgi:DNA-binding LytR/AlgR family response regulator
VHLKVHFFVTPYRDTAKYTKGGDAMGNKETSGGSTNPNKITWVAIIGKEESLKIPNDEVLFIEQIGSTLHVQKDDELVHVPGRISDLFWKPGEPFFQSHSYLLVNITRVHSMKKGKIIFDNLLPKYLSRDCYVRTRKFFNRYLLGQ